MQCGQWAGGGSRPGWAVMQKVPLPAPPLNPVPPSSPTPPPVPPTSPAPPAPPPFGSMVGASGGRPQANMHCTPIPPAPKLHSLSSQTILLSKSPETRSHSNPFLLMSQQGHKKRQNSPFWVTNGDCMTFTTPDIHPIIIHLYFFT